MSTSEVALSVRNIRKSFHLPTEQASGLKQAFLNYTKGIKGYREYEVLKDISFTVEKGDFFGIIGRNGSGKSTLLKIISQIYQPDSGEIKVDGRLISFIELGVGFNPELTGRENIYLNGALLGFSHKEVGDMYDDIVEFAELHDFMDQKLKNYSSGMQVRLAFSIAIKAQGDILVLDEVLAVGDEAFQRKCYKYFMQLKNEKKTVILVTHDMNAVRQYCNKAILIDEGRIAERSNGSIENVARSYSRLFMTDDEGESRRDYKGKARDGDGRVVYDNISHELTGDSLRVEFDVINTTKKTMTGLNTCLNIYSGGNLVTGSCYDFVKREGLSMKPKEKKHMSVVIPNVLGKHEYSIDMGIHMDGGRTTCDMIRGAVKFYNGYSRTQFFKVFTVGEFCEE
ncbi:MAG: ABC transporter ATP-binding protein [Candidatus Saccharibacteria bacterium]|nr:ABC transporter ATP-binding protein [Candidatus Saccharibacteria bacterium]